MKMNCVHSSRRQWTRSVMHGMRWTDMSVDPDRSKSRIELLATKFNKYTFINWARRQILFGPEYFLTLPFVTITDNPWRTCKNSSCWGLLDKSSMMTDDTESCSKNIVICKLCTQNDLAVVVIVSLRRWVDSAQKLEASSPYRLGLDFLNASIFKTFAEQILSANIHLQYS